MSIILAVQKHLVDLVLQDQLSALVLREWLICHLSHILAVQGHWGGYLRLILICESVVTLLKMSLFFPQCGSWCCSSLRRCWPTCPRSCWSATSSRSQSSLATSWREEPFTYDVQKMIAFWDPLKCKFTLQRLSTMWQNASYIAIAHTFFWGSELSPINHYVSNVTQFLTFQCSQKVFWMRFLCWNVRNSVEM